MAEHVSKTATQSSQTKLRLLHRSGYVHESLGAANASSYNSVPPLRHSAAAASSYSYPVDPPIKTCEFRRHGDRSTVTAVELARFSCGARGALVGVPGAAVDPDRPAEARSGPAVAGPPRHDVPLPVRRPQGARAVGRGCPGQGHAALARHHAARESPLLQRHRGTW
jgi:hypothetical protein